MHFDYIDINKINKLYLFSFSTIQLVHDFGVHIKWIFIVYFVLAVTAIMIFTFVLPPEIINEDEVDRPSKSVQSDEDNLIEKYEKCEESDTENDPVKKLFKKTDITENDMETKST